MPVKTEDLKRKTTQLKAIITSKELEFLMEAHNGLSAKIVEETGFKGIWASGLSISASLGVRDNNEASWSQVIEVAEFMSDATTIPILLDGDTGYGDFNSVRRLIKKLEQRNIAGVCIEDKLFPKKNSFLEADRQPLADPDEFSGKIKAAKDSQKDGDFVIVARVEAFIAGWGAPEALRRAELYRQAGADAILVHSKLPNPSEIQTFMKEWAGRHPVIIVPTKFYSTPTERFREMGVSVVIWANHNIRAAAGAIQETAAQIFRDQSLIHVEDRIVPVAEIFRLQGAEELEEAEKKYLPSAGKNMNAVILAASQGERFQELTRDIPKALLKVQGKTILDMQIGNFNRLGIKDITVIRGFAKEKVNPCNVRTLDNDDYAATQELYSLYLARGEIKENTVVSYGDIIYKRYILNELLNDPHDITLVVDADWHQEQFHAGGYRDFVKASEPYSRKSLLGTASFENMSTRLEKGEIHGEFIGLWKIGRQGICVVRETLEEMACRENFRRLRMADFFNALAAKTRLTVLYIRGSWLDIDEIADLHRASEL